MNKLERWLDPVQSLKYSELASSDSFDYCTSTCVVEWNVIKIMSRKSLVFAV